MSIRASAIALVLALLAPAAGAQAPSRGPVFRADLELVNLTVAVRDAKGRFVSDLSEADFAVYEDGRPQTIRLFAPAVSRSDQDPLRAASASDQEQLALNLGLLMDTSESMAKEIRLSQEAAIRFLEAIPRARDLLTIFFDQDIRLSRFQSEQQQGLFERIVESKGIGMTALYDAIAVYLSRVEDVPGRKVLVVFTDGEDSTSALSLAELIQLVRSCRVTIYPVAFTGMYALGSNKQLSARAFLQTLADLTGGQVFTPRSSKDLPDIYAKILEELQTQYVIGYTSDNPKRDGKFRKLRVEVKGPGLKVRFRTGYTAPKD